MLLITYLTTNNCEESNQHYILKDDVGQVIKYSFNLISSTLVDLSNNGSTAPWHTLISVAHLIH